MRRDFKPHLFHIEEKSGCICFEINHERRDRLDGARLPLPGNDAQDTVVAYVGGCLVVDVSANLAVLVAGKLSPAPRPAGGARRGDAGIRLNHSTGRYEGWADR